MVLRSSFVFFGHSPPLLCFSSSRGGGAVVVHALLLRAAGAAGRPSLAAGRGGEGADDAGDLPDTWREAKTGDARPFWGRVRVGESIISIILSDCPCSTVMHGPFFSASCIFMPPSGRKKHRGHVQRDTVQTRSV